MVSFSPPQILEEGTALQYSPPFQEEGAALSLSRPPFLKEGAVLRYSPPFQEEGVALSFSPPRFLEEGALVVVARRPRKPQATWQRWRPHPHCRPQELWMDVLWESEDRRDCVHQCSNT